MKRTTGARAIIALCFLTVLSASFADVGLAADERSEIISAVEDFLADLGELRLEQAARRFLPGAVRIVSRKGTSDFSHTLHTAGEWMEELKNNPNAKPFREELIEPVVTVESGQLAHVRAAFRIAREGSVVAMGVNHFILQRRGGAWRIAALAYTNIPEPAR